MSIRSVANLCNITRFKEVTVSVTIPYISISRIFILIFLFLLCCCSVPVYLVMVATPESRHVMASTPESCYVMAATPESSHFMAATPESSHLNSHQDSVFLSRHDQHTLNFTYTYLAPAAMELGTSWISLITGSVLGRRKLTASVMDPSLRLVRAAIR